jgi:hypothetical protein
MASSWPVSTAIEQSPRLPADPKNLMYEDFVGAWLSALGYFTETRIRQFIEKQNVLELDAVISNVADPPDRMLVEAKSGSWGFADVFKVYGWRSYLEIPRGFVVAKTPPDATKLKLGADVFAKTDVTAMSVTPAAMIWDGPIAPALAMDEPTRQLVLDVAWHSRVASRHAKWRFEQLAKTNGDDELYQRARAYDYAVEASFFATTAQERIRQLYAAFKESPLLTGQFVDRIVKKKGLKIDDIYTALQNSAQRPDIQHVMALEHRARILIVRHALDVVPPADDEEPAWKAFRRDLPKHFREGLDHLRGLDYRTRVPFLLQVFFEYFGGMYTEDADLTLLARITGLTTDQVTEGITVLDVFFPSGDGNDEDDDDDDAWSWCFTSHGDRLTRLKMCPAFMRGAGALMHRFAGKHEDFDHLNVRGELYDAWQTALLAFVQAQIKKDG